MLNIFIQNLTNFYIAQAIHFTYSFREIFLYINLKMGTYIQSTTNHTCPRYNRYKNKEKEFFSLDAVQLDLQKITSQQSCILW